MELKWSILIKLLIVQYLSVLCVSQDFDFFYFVQQVSLVLLSLYNIVLFNVTSYFLSFFFWFWKIFCWHSGQEHTVTQSTLAATLKLGSLQQILAFMDSGLITRMDRTLQTAIQTVSLINLRYITFIFYCDLVSYKW